VREAKELGNAVKYRCPHQCAFVEGSPHIYGYWMVDRDQADSKWWCQDPQGALNPDSYQLRGTSECFSFWKFLWRADPRAEIGKKCCNAVSSSKV